MPGEVLEQLLLAEEDCRVAFFKRVLGVDTEDAAVEELVCAFGGDV